MNIGLNGLGSVLLSLDTNFGNIILDFDCDASVNVGDPIVVSAGVAYTCIPNSEAAARWIAVCVAKASSTVCTIQCSGFSTKIYTGLTPGDQYWVAKTGGITNTPYNIDTDSGLWVVSPVGIALTDKILVIGQSPELKVL